VAVTLVACAILLPVSAGAGDGEVLNDQAAVNPGGITPGDSPGFPDTINRRGKYELSGSEVEVFVGDDARVSRS